jgi:hypothetical protein
MNISQGSKSAFFGHGKLCFLGQTAVRPSIFRSTILIALIFTTILLLFGFGCAVGDNQNAGSDDPKAQCIAARGGELGPDVIEKSTPAERSHLLSCALSVVVGEADQSKAERDRLLVKKQKVCDAILSKTIDLKFVDEDGNHLLHYVVLSYLPEQWKVNAVGKLMDMGIDTLQSNKHGNTALDLAKLRGAVKVARMLATKP